MDLISQDLMFTAQHKKVAVVSGGGWITKLPDASNPSVSGCRNIEFIDTKVVFTNGIKVYVLNADTGAPIKKKDPGGIFSTSAWSVSVAIMPNGDLKLSGRSPDGANRDTRFTEL